MRRISYEGWQRDDGLFDIEARLTDTKDTTSRWRAACAGGRPVHDMLARVTIDRHASCTRSRSTPNGVPYPGGCDLPMPDYAKLVGVNLMHGFRKALYDIAGGTHGCTHMTELIAFLPTAAVQTFATPAPRRRAARRQAVPARPLPCAGNVHRHGAPLLPQVVPRRRLSAHAPDAVARTESPNQDSNG